MSWRTAGGVSLIGAGAVLALRPLTTLALLYGAIVLVLVAAGFHLVATGLSGRVGPPWLGLRRPFGAMAGFVAVSAGIVLAAFVPAGYTGLAYAPAALLLCHGLYRVVHAFRRGAASRREATRSAVLGASSILLGLAAARFPDVALVLLAFATAVSLILAGVGLARRQVPAPGRRLRRGRSIIDAVRAAGQMDLGLGEQTILWGHSQGGHAVLWAAGLWNDYAPDLPLQAALAFAPGSDVPVGLENWASSRLTNIFSAYAAAVDSAHYEDVEDAVRPGALATAKAYADRCLSEPGTALTLTASLLQERTIWRRGALEGQLGTRAQENTPTSTPAGPALLLQGEEDTAVAAAMQGGYVSDRCADDWPLEYRTYEGLDHVPLVEPGSPAITDALGWTASLFAGEPPTAGTC